MTRAGTIARRTFLAGAGIVGGGLLVGAGALAVRLRADNAYTLPSHDDVAGFGAWLTIDPTGAVEVVVPQQDMGQGIYALAVLLAADGLKLAPSAVRAAPAPIAARYANPLMMLDGLPFDPEERGLLKSATVWSFDALVRVLGIEATGGSTSTRSITEPIRTCAAVTLDLLARAAGTRLAADPAALTAQDGAFHAPDGRRVSYGTVASEAARLSPREITPPSLTRGGLYIGKGIARPDVPAKTAGEARYGIDARQPGQLYAAIRHAPRLGGRLVRATLGAQTPGVRGLVEGHDYVAVVADGFATALEALGRARIEWDAQAGLTLTSADVFAAYRAALDRGAHHARRFVLDAAGDPTHSPAGAQVLSASYQMPFLAHAAMEPINATARVTQTACEIWAGHQSPTLVRLFAARACGLATDAVVVHTPWLGGGFGRRADLAYIGKAVEIAQRSPGTPVQTIWTRAEDFRDDVFRPAAMADVAAALDAGGLPATFTYRIAGPSISEQFVGRLFPGAPGGFLADRTGVDGAVFPLYALPNRSIESVVVDLGVPVGFWRSVGYSLNAFVVESFVDELAHAAGLRPLDYRTRLLGLAEGDAAKRASTLIAHLARHDARMPAEASGDGVLRGRGFALTQAYHSLVGHAADVEIRGTAIRVTRVFVVVDCGFAIDPPNVKAQIRGAVNFGLSAALFGRVEIENGCVVPENFDTYPVLTLADAPDITVEILDSGAALGGIGEVGTPGIAPAVGNAIFAATGRRLRRLPFTLAEA